jgi:IS30 family transposase
LVLHQRSEIPFEVIEYNADHAHTIAKYEGSAKGPSIKIGSDRILENAIKYYLKEFKYSPYAIIATFNKTGWPSDTRICEKTLYTYINNEYMKDISSKDLLYKGKRRKPTKGPRKHSRAYAAEHSISKRPKEVNNRSTIGNWECDSVVGPKGNGSTSLFTCTERVTKLEIIRKVPSRKREEVVKTLDTLEQATGSAKFKKIFKTLTSDNGVEFSDGEGMVKSVLTKGKRFDLYYAHPYSSFERGTNENHNGIIRRWIPKGREITAISKKKIRWIQNWMNTYPRKSLGGLTPIEKYNEINDGKYKLPSFIAIKEVSNE